MIGPEAAAVLEPVVKWAAIVGGSLAGAVLFVWFLWSRIRRSGKDSERLGTLEGKEKERHDAREDYREDLDCLLDRWRARRRLRDREGGGDPAA